MTDTASAAAFRFEGFTAFATFALALVTVLAIIAPILQRNRERVKQNRIAIRQLRFFVLIYQKRLNALASDPKWRPVTLLQGLNEVLPAVLSSDFLQSLPASDVVMAANLALLNAHATLVLSVQQYEISPYIAQGAAQKAVERLKLVVDDLYKEQIEYEVKVKKLFPYWFRRVELRNASAADYEELKGLGIHDAPG